MWEGITLSNGKWIRIRGLADFLDTREKLMEWSTLMSADFREFVRNRVGRSHLHPHRTVSSALFFGFARVHRIIYIELQL
mmetsp:Transcript_4419/g.16656  ORF Transcript_4419/g.16656 Transcript_4419/m.16656 type:complete len:80 (+) Transcript_4419:360-599(+)